MSVIPFEKDGSSKTFSSSKTDFSLNGDIVVIQDIDEHQLDQNSRDGNATYNFRFGRRYRDYNDSDITTVELREPVYIAPGRTIVIETLEFVHFPTSRYGLILPRVSLLQRGLSTVASKVDPGYQGHLTITLFNHSRDTASVLCGDEFCSLTMLNVASPSRPYDKVSKTLAGNKKGIFKKVRDHYFRNIGLITLVNTAILLVVLGSRFFDFYDSFKDLFNWVVNR